MIRRHFVNCLSVMPVKTEATEDDLDSGYHFDGCHRSGNVDQLSTSVIAIPYWARTCFFFHS